MYSRVLCTPYIQCRVCRNSLYVHYCLSAKSAATSVTNFDLGRFADNRVGNGLLANITWICICKLKILDLQGLIENLSRESHAVRRRNAALEFQFEVVKFQIYLSKAGGTDRRESGALAEVQVVCVEHAARQAHSLHLLVIVAEPTQT